MAELRLTVSTFGPGPEMVMLLLMKSSSLVNPIVPVTAKIIVSPSFASASAWRNEPGPLSLVLVTVMVSAFAGIATAQSNATAVATDLIVERILVLVSGCRRV